jgi:hypothetical protein
MGRREAHQAQQQRDQFDDYIRKTAASGSGSGSGGGSGGGGSSADELAKLADMKSAGHLSDEEFQRAKEKLLH